MNCYGTGSGKGGGGHFFRAKLLSALMEVNVSYGVVLKVSKREIFVAVECREFF